MKKILIVFCCTFLAVFAFASKIPNAIPKNIMTGKSVAITAVVERKELLKEDCSATITLTANLYIVSITATCTASAVKCDDAVAQATSCASSALNKMKQIINK
jgi:hypothetical protein